MREKLERLLQDVLRPILQADDADAKLIQCTDARVEIVVSGTAAYAPGAPLVREHVVQAAVRKLVGPGPHIEIRQGAYTLDKGQS